MKKILPVRETMCPTCPFRDGVPKEYACLRSTLALSALSEASHICHSTSSNNAFHAHTGKPPSICRGSRDVQLRYFYAIGFINAPTDEAWAKKWAEMQRDWCDEPIDGPC